ncbi:MAG: hypothetical protein BroJett040_16060 [Oligoflexia bacterium]|nr:MAG: hypothetical protein BroJett040_16060 [Oligoflexia bacterium]
MIKTKWIDDVIKYDGTQLKSLYAYLQHGILGNSVIAWRGPCEIDFDHMVDGEDLLDQSQICGDDMVHFIFELFDQSLFSAVNLQRLFASSVKDVISEMTKGKIQLRREGDDLYLEKKKFSISIAARSPNSVMIHFAVNIVTDGTPVPTVCLEDFEINPQNFAKLCLEKVEVELNSIFEATWKVRSV